MIRNRPPQLSRLAPVLLLWSLLTVACSDDPVSSGYSPKAPGPYLYLPDTTFDFGIVPQNSTVSHDFSLVSAGTDTVVIDRVNPG